MARKRMVTRTVKGESLRVLCVDTVTRETTERTVIVTEKFNNDSKKLVHIATMFDATMKTVKPVAIIESTPVSKRYGMPEELFIELATETPTNDEDNDEMEDNDNV